ncbi:MAG: flippase-like domain-containing protein [Desulfobacterales bacterium]|nr:MAG: flippase-like domain-containing protein [Desulfobacterales bacterium]
MNLLDEIKPHLKMESSKIERGIKFIKLLTGVGIAYALIHMLIRYTGADLWEEIARANRWLLLLAVLWFSGSIYFLVERLYILLRIQGIHLSRWDVARVSMISFFINIVIPGAVSGDLIKMIYVAKQAKKKEAEALLTIFWDRVIGMVGLMVVATLIILIYLPRILSLEAQYYYLQMAILTVGLGCLLGGLLFFLLLLQSYRKNSSAGRLFEWVHSKIPKKIIPIVDRLTAAINLYRNNLNVILKTLFLSVLNHFWMSTNLFLIGWCVGEHIMQLGDYILATQVGNLIAVLPITPGGIGTRDAGSALIFQALGSQMTKAGVIPVMMTFVILFWRLVGGWFFIFSKSSKVSTSESYLPSEGAGR